MLQSLPLVFVLAGLVLYTALGGADFGAGFWQLVAGRGQHAERVREHAHDAMAPVWEANHVWLIFVLTVFWTAYPTAFGSIASTLAVPLFIAVVGIIFRGAAYAFRSGASSPRESGVVDTIFSVSSIVTPFALGAAIGGIATNRVPVGNAAGHLFSSWLNPTSVFVGVLAVASCAYLAAVYLAADAARDGHKAIEGEFRARALAAGVVAGVLAISGLFVVNADRHGVFHSLVTGRALPAVIASFLAGLATLVLVLARRYEPARYGAALAIAAVIGGLALARSAVPPRAHRPLRRRRARRVGGCPDPASKLQVPSARPSHRRLSDRRVRVAQPCGRRVGPRTGDRVSVLVRRTRVSGDHLPGPRRRPAACPSRRGTAAGPRRGNLNASDLI
jgi:cytochrome d ubiquinol oxidase subunit II